MAGRKTKLTPEIQECIIEAVGAGATYEIAALAGGISYDTLHNWFKRGAREAERRTNGGKPSEVEDQFFVFFGALKKAEGDAAVRWLRRIDAAAAAGEWQAAAWKLERRYPHVYGRRALEVTGRDSGPVVLRVVYDDDRVSGAPTETA